MARKKMTKKANKVKVVRKAKKSALTVAQALKQLPKLFKKEIAQLKKQAKKLLSALNKAEKQQKKATVALSKAKTPKKLKAAQKAYDKISQTISDLSMEFSVIDDAILLASEKQAVLTILNGLKLKKPAKLEKTSKPTAKAKNKVSKKAKQESLPAQPVNSIEEEIEETVSTPELEVEFDD